MMTDLSQKTIAEIVSEDISTSSVFKKYNIDFCCGGGITVENACKNAEINAEEVIQDLMQHQPKNNVLNLNFKDWSIPFLVDYITNVHHTYIRENISMINEFADKVALVHGGNAPETVEIANLFNALSEDLISHLENEEKLLFPLLKSGELSSDGKYDQNIIELLEDEHDNAGTIVKKIQKLSHNFTPPNWACNTYKALYHKLDEFINDLYQHIHLENNILFFKVKNVK